jgi:hypothetical protein
MMCKKGSVLEYDCFIRIQQVLASGKGVKEENSFPGRPSNNFGENHEKNRDPHRRG